MTDTPNDTVVETPAPEKPITKRSDLPAKATDEQRKLNKIKALAEARSAAASRLQKDRREQFNALIIEEAKLRGYEWKPQPTAEEKALAEAQALLAAHPSLRGKLLGLGNDDA